ncbi:hypothetical protein ACWTU6_19120 [Mesorhizobium sp. BHbsci]
MSISADHGIINDRIFLLIFNPALVRNGDHRLVIGAGFLSSLAAGSDLHGCR